MRPVEPGAGQEPDRATVQPGMHPIAVEFDFVEPLRPFRRLVDEFGELRFDPTGERRRFGAPTSGEAQHLDDRTRRCHQFLCLRHDQLTQRADSVSFTLRLCAELGRADPVNLLTEKGLMVNVVAQQRSLVWRLDAEATTSRAKQRLRAVIDQYARLAEEAEKVSSVQYKIFPRNSSGGGY